MATVGEMVKQVWDKKVIDEDMIRLRFDIVPLSNAIDILHDLGIWDAEVLELPVCRLHCADCAFHLQFPSALLPEPGATVRVIVLKEE